jgi:hypothetical protein
MRHCRPGAIALTRLARIGLEADAAGACLLRRDRGDAQANLQHKL